MKIFILVAATLLFFSCHTVKKAKKNVSENDIYVSDKRMERKQFFYVYKMNVFVQSIQYSFNDSPEIRKLLAEDKSAVNAIDFLDLEDINSVARKVAAMVKQDSVLYVAEAPGDLKGKRAFKICLEYYNSKELDSIARKLYKTKYGRPYVLRPISDTVNSH
nr:hypothetical protein [uncultured Mucilaginibacter sp.]